MGTDYTPIPRDLVALSQELESLGGGDARVAPLEVFCRIKPPVGKLPEDSVAFVEKSGDWGTGSLGIRDPRISNTVPAADAIRHYPVTRALCPKANDKDLFLCLGLSALNWFWDGFNGTIIATGQTGTGKTHSLFGKGNRSTNGDTKGLLTRVISALFELIQGSDVNRVYHVGLSCWEVLGNDVTDLLLGSDPGGDGEDSPHLPGSSPFRVKTVRVDCVEEAEAVLAHAREVSVNWDSVTYKDAPPRNRPLPGRAHAFVRLTLHVEPLNRVSSLYFVDLVGAQSLAAQRLSSTLPGTGNANTPQREAERKLISKSLLAFNRVIAELSHQAVAAAGAGPLSPQHRNQHFVPARSLKLDASRQPALGPGSTGLDSTGPFTSVDSTASLLGTLLHSTLGTNGSGGVPGSRLLAARVTRLTQLLGTLLAGNSKTWLLATVSGGARDYLDTVNTLRVATRARAVTTACMRYKDIPCEQLNMIPLLNVLSWKRVPRSVHGGSAIGFGSAEVNKSQTMPLRPTTGWLNHSRSQSKGDNARLTASMPRAIHASFGPGTTARKPTSEEWSDGAPSPSAFADEDPNLEAEYKHVEGSESGGKRAERVSELGGRNDRNGGRLADQDLSPCDSGRSHKQAGTREQIIEGGSVSSPVQAPRQTDLWSTDLGQEPVGKEGSPTGGDRKTPPHLQRACSRPAEPRPSGVGGLAAKEHAMKQRPGAAAASPSHVNGRMGSPAVPPERSAYSLTTEAGMETRAAAAEPEEDLAGLERDGIVHPLTDAEDSGLEQRASAGVQQPGYGVRHRGQGGAKDGAWGKSGNVRSLEMLAEGAMDSVGLSEREGGAVDSNAVLDGDGDIEIGPRRRGKESMVSGSAARDSDETQCHSNPGRGSATGRETEGRRGGDERGLEEAVRTGSAGHEGAQVSDGVLHGEGGRSMIGVCAAKAFSCGSREVRWLDGGSREVLADNQLDQLKSEFRNICEALGDEDGLTVEVKPVTRSGDCPTVKPAVATPYWVEPIDLAPPVGELMPDEAARTGLAERTDCRLSERANGRFASRERGRSQEYSAGCDKGNELTDGAPSCRQVPAVGKRDVATVSERVTAAARFEAAPPRAGLDDHERFLASSSGEPSTDIPNEPRVGKGGGLYSERGGVLCSDRRGDDNVFVTGPKNKGVVLESRVSGMTDDVGGRPRDEEAVRVELSRLQRDYDSLLNMLQREKQRDKEQRQHIKELENDLLECSTAYDIKIDGLKVAIVGLRSRCRQLETGTDLAAVFQQCEEELARTTAELESLCQENAQLQKAAAAARLEASLSNASSRDSMSPQANGRPLCVTSDQSVGSADRKALAGRTSGETGLVRALRRQLRRVAAARDAERKDAVELRRQARRFGVQRRCMNEAIQRIMRLQWELEAKEKNLIERSLAEREARARMQQAQEAAQKAQVAETEVRKECDQLCVVVTELKDQCHELRHAHRRDNTLNGLAGLGGVLKAGAQRQKEVGGKTVTDLIHKLQREVGGNGHAEALLRRLANEINDMQAERGNQALREECLVAALETRETKAAKLKQPLGRGH